MFLIGSIIYRFANQHSNTFSSQSQNIHRSRMIPSCNFITYSIQFAQFHPILSLVHQGRPTTSLVFSSVHSTRPIRRPIVFHSVFGFFLTLHIDSRPVNVLNQSHSSYSFGFAKYQVYKAVYYFIFHHFCLFLSSSQFAVYLLLWHGYSKT